MEDQHKLQEIIKNLEQNIQVIKSLAPPDKKIQNLTLLKKLFESTIETSFEGIKSIDESLTDDLSTAKNIHNKIIPNNSETSEENLVQVEEAKNNEKIQEKDLPASVFSQILGELKSLASIRTIYMPEISKSIEENFKGLRNSIMQKNQNR